MKRNPFLRGEPVPSPAMARPKRLGDRLGGRLTGVAAVALMLGVSLFCAPARANLCDSVKDTTTTAETQRDVDFYEQLFPDPTGAWRGKRRWNEIVLQCNRQRDTKGGEVAKITATQGTNADRKSLESKNLDAKVIRGHYNFFGTVATQLKYVYVLSKTNGVWNMVIPYNPIINDVVQGRIDFDMDADGHAWKLYDASQMDPAAKVLALKPGARPIADDAVLHLHVLSRRRGQVRRPDAAPMPTSGTRRTSSSAWARSSTTTRAAPFYPRAAGSKRDRDVYWVDPASGKVLKC